MSKDNSGMSAGTPAAAANPVAANPPAGTGTPAGDSGTSADAAPADNSTFLGDGKAAAGNDFLKGLPAEYQSDPAFKDYKDINGLLKSHKNAISMVGKKAIERPGDNATPEQISAFRKAIGVPDSVAEYKFEATDFSKIGPNAEGFQKELGDFAEVFHKLGIPPKEANELQKEYWNRLGSALETIKGGTAEQQAARSAQLDQEFTEMTTKRFGDKKDQVIAEAKGLMQEFATPEDVAAMEKLDNHTLGILINTLHGVRSKYMSEGNTPNNGTTAMSYASEDQLRAQSKDIYARMIKPGMNQLSKEYQDLHAQYKEISNKLNALPLKK